MLAQGLLSLGFSAFWSTSSVVLHAAPFCLGSICAGAFGLAGAARALGAPAAGRVADKHGPELVTRLGAGLAAAAFGALLLSSLLDSYAQLALIPACAVVFDLGVRVSLVGHQTIIYSIDPGARSRSNAVLFVGMFAGMPLGAALGSVLLARFGWAGVSILALGSALAALAVRLWPHARR